MVSVCLPARDEAATVGAIVERLVRDLVEGAAWSTRCSWSTTTPPTRTRRIATDAGARVVGVDEVLPELGPGEGKGEALYKSVAAAMGDLIAWCDADIVDFEPHFVVGLLGPLLTRAEVDFVKGFYDRPLDGRHPRRRPGHRADGPSRDRQPVPPAGLHRAAARR